MFHTWEEIFLKTDFLEEILHFKDTLTVNMFDIHQKKGAKILYLKCLQKNLFLARGFGEFGAWARA